MDEVPGIAPGIAADTETSSHTQSHDTFAAWMSLSLTSCDKLTPFGVYCHGDRFHQLERWFVFTT